MRAPPPHPQDLSCCLSPDDALAACDGKAAAPEALAHIERCEHCRVLVAEAARALVDVGAAPRAPLLTLREGEQVAGRYRIVKFLARGGMGEVYEAFDEVLQEPVAVKTLIATALDDDRAMARLVVEVRLARRVTHPNVCRILEFGFHAPASWKGARLPLVTMELLSGETLAQRLARVGRLGPEAALPFARQMVAGLAAIHDAGIVHRDWKSDNAFITRSAAGVERLVIMDFGLAHTPPASSLALTTSAAIAGTADYIAPEQLTGQPVTPAADIYALGVVLYEMVTGRRPFTGASAFETAVNRLRVRPPAPSALVPGLPKAWDEAVFGCLEERPEHRFQRVAEVLAALEGRGAARPLGRRLRQRLRAHGRGVVATAGLAGAMLVTTAAWLGTRAPAVPPRTQAAAEPPAVPMVAKPALVGTKWPTREIPVCVQAVETKRDPEARVFEVHAMLDFTWNEVADLWLKDAGPCPPDARGMLALTLSEGNHHRADLGYSATAPVRVHLGVDPAGLYDRIVHAFGRALGFALRGERVLSSDEVTLVRGVYGRKPPGSLLGPWGRCISRGEDKPQAAFTRCTGGPDQSWRPASQTRQLRNAAGEPVCLGVRDPSVKKQPLVTTGCSGSPGEILHLRGVSWRAVGERCVTAFAAEPGAELGIGDCTRAPLQRWNFFDGDERIRLHGTDLCVTAPDDAVALGVGTLLALERCRKAGAGQRFHFQKGGHIKLDQNVDLCFTFSIGADQTGRLVLGSWCGREPAPATQVFAIAGPIQVGDGCLSVQGPPDDATPIWSLPCVGGWRNQSWHYYW
jgi:tRNA A-37 threonylcarbamoyl transferase component Bud32